MITEDKINIFKKYGGDIDSLVRSGSKKEELTITDTDLVHDWLFYTGVVPSVMII